MRNITRAETLTFSSTLSSGDETIMPCFSLLRFSPLFFFLLFCTSHSIGAQLVVNDDTHLVGDNNPGDGVCDTALAGSICTLRAAIEEANAHSGPDVITFSKKFNYTLATMPAIEVTDNDLTIDGSNQWDTVNDRPGVELTCGPGSGGPGSAPAITVQAGNFTVKGIMFKGYCNGVSLRSGAGHIIGGAGTGERNVFFNTIEPCIYLEHALATDGSTAATISNNYFGTINGESHLDATDYLGDTGIWLNRDVVEEYNSDIVIENNIIGEQDTAIKATYTKNIIIRNNQIGQLNGQNLPNREGIALYNGSEASITGNIIVASTSMQVYIDTSSVAAPMDNNSIAGGFYSSPPETGIVCESIANSTISNNTIRDHAGDGINLTGVNTVLGNTIMFNGGSGIQTSSLPNSVIRDNTIIWNNGDGIAMTGGSGTVVKGNRIGITEVGFNGSNGGNGIYIQSASNIIGSSTAGDENYIGWNSGHGIYVNGASSTNNQIGGNIIGSTPVVSGTYTKAANGKHGIGIYNQAESNKIGQIGAIFTANYIVNSTWSGIAVVNSNHNTILFNYIGTDSASRGSGNNYWGIHVTGTSNNNILKANTVAYNGFGATPPRAGIAIDGADTFGNNLIRNSLFHNGGKGIELLNGGNQDLAPPTLQRNGNVLTGTTYPNSDIQFYSGSEKDQGQFYEGATTSNGSGVFSWTQTGSFRGKYVMATVTNVPGGSTSEYSFPVKGAFPYILFQHVFSRRK